jgi:hypothetical protein
MVRTEAAAGAAEGGTDVSQPAAGRLGWCVAALLLGPLAG